LRAPRAVVSCFRVVVDASQSPWRTVPTIRVRQLPPSASAQHVHSSESSQLAIGRNYHAPSSRKILLTEARHIWGGC
jgi:hypothetical protein